MGMLQYQIRTELVNLFSPKKAHFKKFRYSEKTTKISPIFQFWHYLAASNYKNIWTLKPKIALIKFSMQTL